MPRKGFLLFYYNPVCKEKRACSKSRHTLIILLIHLFLLSAFFFQSQTFIKCCSTAGNLEGITSKRTQLGTLSIVDNVDEELKRIEEEEESDKEDAVMSHMFGGAADDQSGVLEESGGRAEEA